MNLSQVWAFQILVKGIYLILLAIIDKDSLSPMEVGDWKKDADAKIDYFKEHEA